MEIRRDLPRFFTSGGGLRATPPAVLLERIVTGLVLGPALGLVHTLGALGIAASVVDHPDVIALR